ESTYLLTSNNGGRNADTPIGY
ncbi:MAG: hypothetical protein JWO52_6310, partial [Gammaproteobacteria bacterium]|nr:hypothetical protein [Gammaproteobacteria bacterium]